MQNWFTKNTIEIILSEQILWYYLFSRLSNFRVFRAMADARI